MNAPDVAAAREAQRLEAVRRLQIVDTEPERAYDDIVTVATTVCATPVGFVGFIDRDRHWFKAQLGMDVTHVPREGSLGELTVELGRTLVVANTRTDARTRDRHAIVTSPFVRAYAGVPLYDPDRVIVGVLAVVDRSPRPFTLEQVRLLEALAHQVEQLFALRAALAARSLDRDRAIERETRFHSVLLSLASGLFVHGPDGTIEDCNPAAERLIGYPRDVLIGTNPFHSPSWSADHEDGTPFGDDELPVAITLKYGIDVRDVVMGIRTQDAELRWMLVNSVPLWDQYSRGSGAVVTFADVTDLLTLTNQLQESLGELARAAQERAALLSSVSHDIRAPLAAIRMMTEILEDRADAITETQRNELVRRVRAEARRTEGVLSDLVSANRVGTGLDAPRRRRIDLERIVYSRAREFDGATHAVRVGTLHGELTMWADSAQVERILDNLISNAITHTPPGTRIEIEAAERLGQIDLVVDDDGPGITEDMRERVFSAYVRGDQARDRPGSGLGLFLVRQFAQFHGGTARCEASERGGARFVVSLPRRPGQESVRVG